MIKLHNNDSAFDFIIVKKSSVYQISFNTVPAYRSIKELYSDCSIFLDRKKSVADSIIARTELSSKRNVKLTPQDITGIKAEWVPGKLKELSLKYGVCQTSIWNVVNGKTFSAV